MITLCDLTFHFYRNERGVKRGGRMRPRVEPSFLVDGVDGSHYSTERMTHGLFHSYNILQVYFLGEGGRVSLQFKILNVCLLETTLFTLRVLLSLTYLNNGTRGTYNIWFEIKVCSSQKSTTNIPWLLFMSIASMRVFFVSLASYFVNI